MAQIIAGIGQSPRDGRPQTNAGVAAASDKGLMPSAYAPLNVDLVKNLRAASNLYRDGEAWYQDAANYVGLTHLVFTRAYLAGPAQALVIVLRRKRHQHLGYKERGRFHITTWHPSRGDELR